MPIETNINLQFIGKLDSRIVGCQYYNSKIKQGEPLHFDRNPRNEFDTNAIEARNDKSEVIGHLPRHHSAFLAPLLDDGRIFLKGHAGQETSQTELPAEIDVYVTDNGKSMLEPAIRDNDSDLVHAIIAAFFKDCHRYSSGTVLKMIYRFKVLTKTNALPESILLSRLLNYKVKEITAGEASRFHEIITARLTGLKKGGILTHRNLGIMPLFSDFRSEADYILLKEALDRGTFDVTEVTESGSVPKLKVNNRGDRPVLILAGDELVGAKQNRIVNITIIISAYSEFVIPVSCVEQNRWAYRSDKFAAGRRANAGLRSKLSRAVRDSVRERGEYDGDQGMVWEEVAHMHCSLGTSSATGAMNDAYVGVEDQLKGFIENIKYPKEAVGMAVFINGRITAVETFDNPVVLEKLWNSQIESYAVDSIMAEEIKPSKDRKTRLLEDQYEKFLKNISQSLVEPVKSPGAGYDVGIDGKDISGAVYLESGRLVFLSAITEKSGRKRKRYNYGETVE